MWVDVCRVEGRELPRGIGSPGTRLQVVVSRQTEGAGNCLPGSLEEQCVLLMAEPTGHRHLLSTFLKETKCHFSDDARSSAPGD